ncbi:MAG: TIR domain-containing protein [Nitrospira sp.]
MRPPAEPQRCDLFLSHGSPDKPWVRTLYQHLTAAGVKSYLDEVAIEAGDNFVCNLSNGIGRTDTFVIVVSHGTMARPWVEHEWTSFLATHGPHSRIIPVLLDDVQLPPFLRPYQVIHAIDRDASAVVARIVRALGKGQHIAFAERYTGQSLIFTLVSIESSKEVAVIPADGVRRTVTPPWRNGNVFGIALRDFEKMTREAILDAAARTSLTKAAQTVGTGLLALLVSDEDLRAAFDRATAVGSRAVLTVRSEEDALLALPWELLYRDGHFLVRDGMLDVVRSTTGAVQFETQLAPPKEAFTLVTNVSAPEGSGLSYEAESYRITHALTEQCPETPTELGTLEDLVATVARERPCGIHFSGHGTPGALVFENDEGFEDRVEIDRLVTELRQRGDGALPPFFYLACCHGNTPPQPAKGQGGSASSAAQLHRAGVTEVVGYYGPIADELSTRAEEALYGAIAAGDPTRLAIGKARAALLRTFADEESVYRPDLARDPGASVNVAHPFAWAQLVLYRRGPEHPLSTPASREKLRRHEASLSRTYRNLLDRTFLETGFIGRRRELHQLRRRRKRGDRVVVLQGLGGLGKTTLAGQLLPMLADEGHTVTLWCRRTEGEQDQAEALVGQLLVYARARFDSGFEQVVSHVDREAGEDSVRRFATFLQVILAQEKDTPLVVYLDNLESLLQGPDHVSVTDAPDSEAFGEWRSDVLRDLWRMLVHLSGAVGNLYVVASCRYRNDDLAVGLQPVTPLADGDLFRLMAWFPALRRLSAGTRVRLAGRLAGHPRGVEFMEDLVSTAIRKWEETQGEWSMPAPGDRPGMEREWEQLIVPILPRVEDRIWSDLLLVGIWERVLEERARRMLFRMTLLRRPWEDGLIAHLGEPEEGPDLAHRTAEALASTSLLEQIDRTVRTRQGLVRRRHYTVHAATAAFVQSRFSNMEELARDSHHRIGTYLEKEAETSPDLTIDLEAGHHLFEANEYDRAWELLGAASNWLQERGMVREGLQTLLPFLSGSVQQGMGRDRVGWLLGTVGLAYHRLGEPRRAIEYYEQALAIGREVEDPRIIAACENGLRRCRGEDG